jgi:hypothetical protein
MEGTVIANAAERTNAASGNQDTSGKPNSYVGFPVMPVAFWQHFADKSGETGVSPLHAHKVTRKT